MAYHCAVTGCSNGSYRLKKWKNEHKEAGLQAPFTLHAFPTEKKAPERRKIWIQNINRLEPGSKTKLFTPSKDSRICSYHFIDGKPTNENPDPTEGLGYNFEDKQRRRNENNKSTATQRQSRRYDRENKKKKTT